MNQGNPEWTISSDGLSLGLTASLVVGYSSVFLCGRSRVGIGRGGVWGFSRGNGVTHGIVQGSGTGDFCADALLDRFFIENEHLSFGFSSGFVSIVFTLAFT